MTKTACRKNITVSVTNTFTAFILKTGKSSWIIENIKAWKIKESNLLMLQMITQSKKKQTANHLEWPDFDLRKENSPWVAGDTKWRGMDTVWSNIPVVIVHIWTRILKLTWYFQPWFVPKEQNNLSWGGVMVIYYWQHVSCQGM